MYLNKPNLIILHRVTFFLSKDNQKEGLFKRVEILKIKTKSCWTHLVHIYNKVSKTAKNERDFNYDSNYVFNDFYKGLKNLKECH